MDAPVIINDESQQSKKFEFMVPQTQFIDDVWTFSLCNDRYVVFWYRKLWSLRSCSSSLAVDIPFVPQKLIPWPSLLSRLCSCCLFWWSMSLLCESCMFSGAVVEKTFALPQLQLVEKSHSFYGPSYLAVTCSTFVFGAQVYGLFWEMTSGCFPYSALFGSTLDACYVSLRRIGFFTCFYVGLLGSCGRVSSCTPVPVVTSGAAKPGCSASWPVWTRWTVTWRDSGGHGRRHFLHGAEADSHGPVGPQSFPIGVFKTVVDVPVCRSCRFFVAVCVKTVEIPQFCSSSSLSWRRCRFPWSLQPLRFSCCSTLIRWSTSRL